MFPKNRGRKKGEVSKSRIATLSATVVNLVVVFVA